MRERLQKVERMERVMSVEQTNKTGTEMGGTINGWLAKRCGERDDGLSRSFQGAGLHSRRTEGRKEGGFAAPG